MFRNRLEYVKVAKTTIGLICIFAYFVTTFFVLFNSNLTRKYL